ncbi:MAG: RagB/SusD family nutrient uptake outer membrane protein, partial [Bacteroidota bacterium]
MKNLNIKHLLATITLGAVLLSCSDQLEQINPNALTNESFWTNVADLNSGLNATYAALRDDDVLGILWEYTRTDIAVPFSMRVRSIGNPIYDQTFDLSTNNVQNKWDACFRGVFRANQVIDAYRRLESTLTNDDSREAGRLVFAQARALRGYFYYVLHHSFNDGSLPLFSSVPVEVDDFQQAFSTSDSVASFFRADLEYGVENLPATYNAWQQEVGNGNLGRVTGGFCEALLAKSYMNENDFATAKGYLENVMINYNYDLVDDLAEVFTGMAEFNRESIFEINFS